MISKTFHEEDILDVDPASEYEKEIMKRIVPCDYFHEDQVRGSSEGVVDFETKSKNKNE